MADLKTNYLGIELKNPLIIGASNLVTDTKNLKNIEEAGAAAVVYKSLFEEQIQLENLQMGEIMDEYNERHAEMTSLFPDVEHAGPKEFLHQISKAREALNIPLIASLNAIYKESWVEYAQKLEETGVDALELNFYSVPLDFKKTGREILDKELEILREIKKAVNIPVSVKLSSHYTNPLYTIKEMDKAGADGFVLFNRLFQPDIDTDNENHFFPYNLSSPSDKRLPLRFAGLLHDEIKASICSNTGIYNGDDVISMLLAGSDAVQIVSTIYKNGIPHISSILEDINKWMDRKGYQSIADFSGKLSRKKMKDPFAYKRAQYVDILLKADEIFKKYPMR